MLAVGAVVVCKQGFAGAELGRLGRNSRTSGTLICSPWVLFLFLGNRKEKRSPDWRKESGVGERNLEKKIKYQNNDTFPSYEK